MEDLPPEWVGWKQKSCPIGYSALTLVNIGGHPVQVCLDSGASVSAIPEELFLILLDQAAEDEAKGTLPISDKRYAIQEIEQYSQSQPMVGIDTSGPGLKTVYGVSLALEFVPHTGSRGVGLNTVLNI